MAHPEVSDLERNRMAVAEIENVLGELPEIDFKPEDQSTIPQAPIEFYRHEAELQANLAVIVRRILHHRIFSVGKPASIEHYMFYCSAEQIKVIQGLIVSTTILVNRVLAGELDDLIIHRREVAEDALQLLEDVQAALNGPDENGKRKKKAGSKFKLTPKHELLPKTELSKDAIDEWRLIREAREGNRDARAKLMKKHMGIIINYIKNNVSFDARRIGLEWAEPQQIAYFAIDRTMHKFDPNTGFRFATYLGYWLMGKLGREIDKLDPNLIPLTFRASRQKFDRKHEQLFRQMGREPNNEEVAIALEWTDEQLETYLKYSTRRLSSLDHQIDEDGSSLHDLIADPCKTHDFQVIELEQKDIVIRALDAIEDERGRDVVERRMGLNGYDGQEQTLEQIGKAWNISREGARLAFTKAIRQMRSALADQGIEMDS